MNETKEPLYLIDILKFTTLVAIVILHANEFIFFVDDVFWGKSAPVYYAASLFARAYAIGGQILVMIIFLLFGLKNKVNRSLIKLSILACLGHVFLAFIFMDDGAFFSAIEWDIYSYIFFTSVILAILPEKFRHSKTLLIFSFIMLWVPTYWLKGLFADNLFWRSLTGDAYPSSTGSWPLLPWFFHALFFFQIGIRIRVGKLDLKHWKKWESFVWPVFFIIAIPKIGAYFWLPIGPNYYRFVFNQSPLTFWSNFLFFLFIARLAFLVSTQNRLREFSLARKLSSLQWCRNVGLLYFISVIYIGFGTLFSNFFRVSPMGYDLFFLSIMPASEFIGRGIVAAFRRKMATA